MRNKLAVGMFCHEFCGWKREVEIEMHEKCVGVTINKGVNKLKFKSGDFSSLVNCLFLFHYLFWGGFSLALSIKSSSSAFSFCLTFSAFMNLSETVTYSSLEGVFLCGSIPIQTACAQCLWWES